MSEQLDTLSDERCEECGATLTQAEAALVLERGGPVLCSVHLAELVEAEEAEAETQSPDNQL